MISRRFNEDEIAQADGHYIAALAVAEKLQLRRVGAALIGPCPRCAAVDRFAIHRSKQAFECRGCG